MKNSYVANVNVATFFVHSILLLFDLLLDAFSRFCSSEYV